MLVGRQLGGQLGGQLSPITPSLRNILSSLSNQRKFHLVGEVWDILFN